MTYHILNGDCLADQLKHTTIDGQVIVCAECLIEGDLSGDTLPQFWTSRANYLASNYHNTPQNYYNKSVPEFEKTMNIPDGAEVCLWFEDDLFCQTNMWFVLALLNMAPAKRKIFRVFPVIHNDTDRWKGFGISSTQMLELAYQAKVLFTTDDLKLGEHLWNAYKTANFEKLKELSNHASPCFQHLADVCQAQIDRFPTDNSLGRPDSVVKEIIENLSSEFEVVFSEFSDREGIYGFGDLQVKNMYNRQFNGTT
jgi:hypothetical protein